MKMRTAAGLGVSLFAGVMAFAAFGGLQNAVVFLDDHIHL